MEYGVSQYLLCLTFEQLVNQFLHPAYKYVNIYINVYIYIDNYAGYVFSE